MTTTDTPVRRKRPVSKPKFAAKCIADNYGRRGSTTWLAVFNAPEKSKRLMASRLRTSRGCPWMRSGPTPA